MLQEQVLKNVDQVLSVTQHDGGADNPRVPACRSATKCQKQQRRTPCDGKVQCNPHGRVLRREAAAGQCRENGAVDCAQQGNQRGDVIGALTKYGVEFSRIGRTQCRTVKSPAQIRQKHRRSEASINTPPCRGRLTRIVFVMDSRRSEPSSIVGLPTKRANVTCSCDELVLRLLWVACETGLAAPHFSLWVEVETPDIHGPKTVVSSLLCLLQDCSIAKCCTNLWVPRENPSNSKESIMTSHSTRHKTSRSDVPVVACCALSGMPLLLLQEDARSSDRNANIATRQGTSGGGLGQLAVKMGFHRTHGVLLV